MKISSPYLLILATLTGLFWSNSPWAPAYFQFWDSKVLSLSLSAWVNEALMVVFFFLVGLEIRREISEGELSTGQKASLPFAAALGGMIFPALIFTAFNWGTSWVRGWAIPMATDISFALGALNLLGRHVSQGLRVFLMAFAIIDDLGAILVIVLFYSHYLSWVSLAFGLGVVGLILVGGLRRIKSPLFYSCMSICLWFSLLKSGIHPTLAGVILAFVLPFSSVTLSRLEKTLSPWVNGLIVPVFALANSGVALVGQSQFSWTHPVTLGVGFGLFFGKQVGIFLASWLAIQLKLSCLPLRTSWRQFYGVASLGGIGFTMALFISLLAFDDPQLLVQAKLGILIATLLSGIWGGVLLRSEA